LFVVVLGGLSHRCCCCWPPRILQTADSCRSLSGPLSARPPTQKPCARIAPLFLQRGLSSLLGGAPARARAPLPVATEEPAAAAGAGGAAAGTSGAADNEPPPRSAQRRAAAASAGEGAAAVAAAGTAAPVAAAAPTSLPRKRAAMGVYQPPGKRAQ